MNPFLREILPYIVQDPLISNQPGLLPDGNAVLYCGVALVIKTTYFPADDGDFLWFSAVYRDARKTRGLLTRGSHKAEDHQSHDDYVGFCAGAQLVQTAWASEILGYGRSHDWVYDNTGISDGLVGWFRCWHLRMPGLVQHYKLCALEPLNFWEQLWWAIGMVQLGWNESGQQLRWLKYRAYLSQPRRHWLCDKAAALWEHRLRRHCPNLMGDVFRVYYGADHIFTRWMMGRV